MSVRTIHSKNLRWVDITNPSGSEINWLKQNFKFEEEHYQSIRERQQRPHIDQGDKYNFIVLMFPVYHEETQEILPGEVDFFIGDDFLVTVHYKEIYTMEKLFSETRDDVLVKKENMSQGSGFLLYKVLELLFRRSYPILDFMSHDVEQIEKKIFHDSDANMLSQITLMKKNIIEFRKMMKTHRFVLEQLPLKKDPYLRFPESPAHYQDLFEYSHNIWDILDALKETVETLQDTSLTLATHRLNEITRIFTILSVIVIPATLIAFWFGVGNDHIPFGSHPFGFWIIGGLMILASFSLLLIAKFKKWF